MPLRPILLLALLALGGCAYVDAGGLEIFACDEGGNCPPDFACCEGQCKQGGCSPTPQDAGEADSGTELPCGPATCPGCCEGALCASGTSDLACGQGGVACAPCGGEQKCAANGACANRSPNGTPCGETTQCQSGYCVDGVCCEGACDGACEFCASPGSEGRCVPLVEGATGAPSCAPRACDGLGGVCPSLCTSLRQCMPGHYCDQGGACILQKVNGQPCGAGSECTSGLCADGVCCNDGCAGSCDRCNLPGSVGSCLPAPAGDPGTPACATTYFCNGTAADCPIPCSAGCPAGTFCGGAYCAAKRANGVTCTQGGSCQSGLCVDGVCCNAACTGACDACSVAAGAALDGTCALLGAARVCRPSADACDKEERCSGASVDCPANGYQPATTACQASGYTVWTACQDGSNICATSGTKTRTRTDHACDANGTCSAASATETQACAQQTEGLVCGTTVQGDWSACTPAAAGSCVGTQSRLVTSYSCVGGLCGTSTTIESRACNVAVATQCGAPQNGSWTNCSASQGSCGGTQSRQETTYACNGAGACVTSTGTGTQACTLAQGTACDGSVYTVWSSCSGCVGTEDRTRTDYACNAAGACAGTATPESRPCTLPDSSPCAPPDYGTWGTCTGSIYACSGTQWRPVTTHTCASGVCGSTSGSQTQSCNMAAGSICSACTCDSMDCVRYRATCNGAGACGPDRVECGGCSNCIPL